ncbi:MAG: peptidoglycan editing factor PgeF [Gallionella sp.]
MILLPDWPAPSNVRALQTRRQGGVSVLPYDSLNLAAHVGDTPGAVAYNRKQLNARLPREPVWLEQVHGATVLDADHLVLQESGEPARRADASFARQQNSICVVMTADCLPVLLCDRQGGGVAAVHAGWRSMALGVIEAAVDAMQLAPEQLMAWLGPAISQAAFEVGDEVRKAFVDVDENAAAAFIPHHAGKWRADLYALARLRLNALGITQIYGGEYCTYHQADQFFSYRRDGVTGRMASFIWLDDDRSIRRNQAD